MEERQEVAECRKEMGSSRIWERQTRRVYKRNKQKKRRKARESKTDGIKAQKNQFEV